MQKFDVFKDIAERTGGDIYLGVVGPVRTGKSTFIKRFLELLVLPNISDPDDRERAVDAMPQAGAGRRVMTSEPKFIPDDGVAITIKDSLHLRVRLVDCVGYTVPGALGYEDEDGAPRMVRTPWHEEDIPFQEAAEIGTRKVIAEHSTFGVVVTSDGTATDLPRKNFVEAERRVIQELRALSKPFVILLNTLDPFAREALDLARELEGDHDVPVIPTNIADLDLDDIESLLFRALYEFPVAEAAIDLPDWVEALEPGHWLRRRFEQAVEESVGKVRRLRDIDRAVEQLRGYDFLEAVALKRMDLGTGLANIELSAKDDLFWQVLQEVSGLTIAGRLDVVTHLKTLAGVKRDYDTIAGALRDARESGYGIVVPTRQEMTFEEPELTRRGGQYAVRLRASAPSLHLLRADIEAELTPIIGNEKQCEELVHYLMDKFEDDPRKIWDSDIFGKSLHELVVEGVTAKLHRMPENARQKLQETLTRIINEGSGGLICIII
ncbi:MAG TPA: stage IV sporulation protein A [Clostridiales bacterium]|nr:stage IV sporulation protein A [Clostridiales bacterium]